MKNKFKNKVAYIVFIIFLGSLLQGDIMIATCLWIDMPLIFWKVTGTVFVLSLTTLIIFVATEKIDDNKIPNSRKDRYDKVYSDYE